MERPSWVIVRSSSGCEDMLSISLFGKVQSSVTDGLTDTKGDVKWRRFNINSQMNSRKQVSNGCDDTLEGEEQIRQMLSIQVQEILDGDRRGILRAGTGG